jgi:hypothetical protein
MCLIVLIFLPVYIIYVSKAWHIGKMEVLKNNFGKTEAKNGKDESKKVEEKRKLPLMRSNKRIKGPVMGISNFPKE